MFQTILNSPQFNQALIKNISMISIEETKITPRSINKHFSGRRHMAVLTSVPYKDCWIGRPENHLAARE